VDKKRVLKIIRRFRELLAEKGIRADRIILYGSHAKGTHREDSDIDIVVISPDFAGKDYWERTGILSDIVYSLFEPIEVIAMTPEEWAGSESPVVGYARDGEVVI